MHATELLDRTIGAECQSIHRVRFEALKAATEAAPMARYLSVTGLGRVVKASCEKTGSNAWTGWWGTGSCRRRPQGSMELWRSGDWVGMNALSFSSIGRPGTDKGLATAMTPSAELITEIRSKAKEVFGELEESRYSKPMRSYLENRLLYAFLRDAELPSVFTEITYYLQAHGLANTKFYEMVSGFAGQFLASRKGRKAQAQSKGSAPGGSPRI